MGFVPDQRRLLVIGLDAVDKTTLFRFAQAGHLPHIARLMERAAWTTSDGLPGLYAGAVWPSFWSALSPARHGRYYYEQLVPGAYETKRVHPHDVTGTPFWETLGRCGRRVAVVDVPKSYVARDLNGVHVVDWGMHDPDYEGLLTWPPPLRNDIVARFGVDQVGNCNADRTHAGQYAELRDALVARVDRKRALVEHVMEMERWDCLVTVFADGHCIGHQCWHLHDPAHAQHDPALREAVGDPVLDVYVALDDAVGKLVSRADANTDVLVFTSHGMRARYDGSFLLDDMLKRIENPRRAPAKKGTIKLAKRAWMSLPAPLRRALRPVRTSARVQMGIAPLSMRKSYAVPAGDACGAIRVNVVGREPEGKIRPGEEYDAWCAVIAHELGEFVNVDTGEPVVRRVMRTSDLYDGPCVPALPDLLVEWNRNHPIARVRSPRLGEVSGVDRKCRTGDHQPAGVVLCAGPSARPGRMERTISIMDIAPTIAERLGVELGDVDGVSFATAAFVDPGTTAAGT